jgi:hypothetical protein
MVSSRDALFEGKVIPTNVQTERAHMKFLNPLIWLKFLNELCGMLIDPQSNIRRLLAAMWLGLQKFVVSIRPKPIRISGRNSHWEVAFWAFLLVYSVLGEISLMISAFKMSDLAFALGFQSSPKAMLILPASFLVGLAFGFLLKQSGYYQHAVRLHWPRMTLANKSKAICAFCAACCLVVLPPLQYGF